jgi:hypothetical protein
MVQLTDRVSIIDKGRSSDGFLKVRARSARAGVYDYLGAEIDPQGKKFKPTDTVKVYRPAEEVFDRASLASFVAKPITDDHPSKPVDASNWRDVARGAIFGAVKDGDYVGFDLAFMDASTIDAIDKDKRELSNGYSCDLSIEDGVAPDGTAYQAVQRNIRGNHVALVDRGRAGPECRVGDAKPERFASCDAFTADQLAELKASQTTSPKETRVKITNLDGMPVNLTDAAAVEAALTKLDQKVSDAETALADATKAHDKAIAAKDAEIDDLKSKVVDQAQIDALADAKAAVVEKAKAICGDKLGETAGKTVAEVRRMALDAKGIDAKDKSDDYVEARFDALTADAKADDKVVSFTPAQVIGDAESSFAEIQSKLSDQRRNAWKNPAPAAAA